MGGFVHDRWDGITTAVGRAVRWLVTRRPVSGSASGKASRVIVFGAGEGGVEVISAMLQDPENNYLPVTLLDDDPGKGGALVNGLLVTGDRTELPRVAEKTGADLLLVAIPTADARLIRDLAERASQVGLSIRVLPPVHELHPDGVAIADIRVPSYADLLGRREVELDTAAIAGYLDGAPGAGHGGRRLHRIRAVPAGQPVRPRVPRDARP